jgi:hypothetical protein
MGDKANKEKDGWKRKFNFVRKTKIRYKKAVGGAGSISSYAQ